MLISDNPRVRKNYFLNNMMCCVDHSNDDYIMLQPLLTELCPFVALHNIFRLIYYSRIITAGTLIFHKWVENENQQMPTLISFRMPH